jgi:hypothetical protein
MTQSPNQFSQSVILGMLDLRFNTETISCRVDSGVAVADNMVAGQAVKLKDVAGKLPVVEPADADSDEIFGFINYDVKKSSFAANDAVEVSRNSNVMYLAATAAIARGAQVCADVSTPGDVQPLADGATIIGYALDKATADGDLIRIVLSTPSFSVYSA